MKLAWTKGLSAEAKEAIRKEFEASGLLRERVNTIIQDKINSARKESTLKSSYDNPNWAYLQADLVGFVRALEELQSIFSK